jgi:hypothetical protein
MATNELERRGRRHTWKGRVMLVVILGLAGAAAMSLTQSAPDDGREIAVTGRVVDRSGGAVPSARVRLGDWDEQGEGGSTSRLLQVLTAQDGSFRAVLPASWTARGVRRVQFIRIWASVDQQRSPERVLSVPPRGERLEAPTLIVERLGTLVLSLKLHDGAPAADADVLLSLQDPSLYFEDGQPARYRIRARTTVDGIARVEGVLLRAYRRVGIGAKLGKRPRQWMWVKNGVELRADERELALSATLSPYATVSGTIRSSDGESPGAFAVAAVCRNSISPLEDLHWQPVDPSGRFTLLDCVLPNSSLWVAARMSEHVRPAERMPVLIRDLDVHGGHRDIGEVVLPATGTLRLEIRQNGELLTTGWVEVQRADRSAPSSASIPISGGYVSLSRMPTTTLLRVDVYPGPKGLEPEYAAAKREFLVQGTNEVHVLSVTR